MWLYIICFIVHLVRCINDYDVMRTDVQVRGGVSEDEYEVETKLNLKGSIRQLFIVELGLNSEWQNIVCSPISAMLPLAKLLLGAKKQSESKSELLAALGLRKSKQLSSVYKQILTDLEYLHGVEISIASRMYLSDKYQLKEKFKNKTKSIFRSSIELVDTSRPAKVADRINQWVADHTNDMIKNLISKDEIAQSASLLLVNAVYFKGTWREPFRPARENTFHSPSGTVRVPMMTKSGKFNYVQSNELNAEILELPYKGEEAAMIIVLPNDNKGLPILLRTLRISYDLLTKALNEMVMVTVDVTIPKFKIETALDLKKYYEKMGINSSSHFKRSSLSEIVKHQTLYISSAIQRAVIEVTERGTAAAAASAVAIVPLSLQFNRVAFIADRPFLFYVGTKQEQLFAGVVNSP